MFLNWHGQVNEGNVGIYYRHGALKDRVTDPGVRRYQSLCHFDTSQHYMKI